MSLISDDDVHAFVDRQLPADRRAAVEQALAGDPALAAKAREIERQNAWLRDGLDALMTEPLPQRLIDAARMPRRPRRAWRWLAIAGTSAATLLVGLAGG